MASITAWAKKVWKDRKTEYPTRRTLTKTDGSQEIVTVARNEGNVYQEGDAFSAANMNDLEERIDAGFTEVNSKLGEDSHYSFTKYGLTFDFFRKGCVCTFYIHGKTTEKLPLYNMDSRFIIPEKYAPCLTYDFSNEFIFPSRLRITSDGGFIDRNDETPIDTEIRVSGSYVCLI